MRLFEGTKRTREWEQFGGYKDWRKTWLEWSALEGRTYGESEWVKVVFLNFLHWVDMFAYLVLSLLHYFFKT